MMRISERRPAPARRPSDPESRLEPTRREFLRLLAAGSAAAMAATLPGTAGAATRKPRPATGKRRPVTAAVRAEIENQKRFVARALEKIRNHPLPAGSDPAFVFTPFDPVDGPSRTREPRNAR
jgi:hypothetical protein